MMSDEKGVVVNQTSHLLYKQMFELRGGPSANVRPQQFAPALAPSTCSYAEAILGEGLWGERGRN